VRFWPYERVSPEVVSNIATYVECEVVATGVIGAGRKPTGEEGLVKAQVFASNSRHDICTEFLLKSLASHRIKIVKNWAVRLENEGAVVGSPIHRLFCTPSYLASESDMVLQEKNSTEAGVKSAAE
jgi:hypothetical protein